MVDELLDYNFFRYDEETDSFTLTEDYAVVGFARTGSLKVIKRGAHGLYGRVVWIKKEFFETMSFMWRETNRKPYYMIRKGDLEPDKKLN